MSHRDKHKRYAGPQSRPTGPGTEQMQATAYKGGPGLPSGAARAGRPTAAEAQDYRADAGGEPGAEPGGAGSLAAGAVHAVGAVGGEAVDTTHGMLRGAMAATEDVGSGFVGGATHVARDLVHGVRDIGGDVGLAVRDGATGLLHVVGDVGGTAVHTVRDLLVDVVSGVRDIAGAAIGRGPASAARQAFTVPMADAPPLRDIGRERDYAAPQDAERSTAPVQSTAAEATERATEATEMAEEATAMAAEFPDLQQGAEGPLPSLRPFPTSRHH